MPSNSNTYGTGDWGFWGIQPKRTPYETPKESNMPSNTDGWPEGI